MLILKKKLPSYQQWDIIEQVCLALSSLDSTRHDLQDVLNIWQRRLYTTLTRTSSTRDCETQTDQNFWKAQNDDSSTLTNLQSRQHKKRVGIKKRITTFFGLGGTSGKSDTDILETKDGSLKKSKKKNSYKIKG